MSQLIDKECNKVTNSSSGSNNSSMGNSNSIIYDTKSSHFEKYVDTKTSCTNSGRSQGLSDNLNQNSIDLLKLAGKLYNSKSNASSNSSSLLQSFSEKSLNKYSLNSSNLFGACESKILTPTDPTNPLYYYGISNSASRRIYPKKFTTILINNNICSIKLGNEMKCIPTSIPSPTLSNDNSIMLSKNNSSSSSPPISSPPSYNSTLKITKKVETSSRKRGRQTILTDEFFCCNIKFDANSLMVHQQTAGHSYFCPVKNCACYGSEVSNKTDLRRHLMTHTDERPHKCERCPKRFRRKQHMIMHMRTHTGEKPFVCEICNRSFAYVGNLARHSEKHEVSKWKRS